jgi:hypothetical protein
MCKKAFLLLVLAIISCSSAETRQPPAKEVSADQPALVQESARNQTAQQVTVGKFKLSLTGCRLTYESQGKEDTVNFDFPGRCQFSRNSKGEIRVVKTGKTKTLLVESSSATGTPDGSPTKDCLTYIRGVIVTSKEILLSVQTQKVAQCLPAAWDEKMFHIFAAKTQSVSKSSVNNSQP